MAFTVRRNNNRMSYFLKKTGINALLLVATFVAKMQICGMFLN